MNFNIVEKTLECVIIFWKFIEYRILSSTVAVANFMSILQSLD